MDDKKDGAKNDDRRRHEHTPVTLVVDYEGADDLVVDYTENLSSGGVFLTTQRALAVGTQVRLLLSFPGLLEPLGISGIVRWIRDGGDEQSGLGIEFEDGEGRQQLHALILRVSQRDPTIVSRLIRVLVAEDNPHVARLIRNGLHGSGRRQFGDNVAFNFRTASNGRDALDLLRTEPFDALIVDIYLPILDGTQLIIEVRADEQLQHIPIIAVSAGGDSARDSALAAGADRFLHKPMRLRQIIDTMRSLIDLG